MYQVHGENGGFILESEEFRLLYSVYFIEMHGAVQFIKVNGKINTNLLKDLH